jgi:hypothetical protein
VTQKKNAKPDGTKDTPPPSPHSIARLGGNLPDLVDEETGEVIEIGERFEVGDSLEHATPDQRRELVLLGAIDPEHPTNPDLGDAGDDTEDDA